MLSKDLVDMGVPKALAEAYTTVTNPKVTIVKPGTGVNSKAQNTPTPGVGAPVGGNTGSASASQLGYTTAGPAQLGQAGHLLVPSNEGGPSTNPPNPPGTPDATPTDPHFLPWEQQLLAWGFTQQEIDSMYNTYSAYADPNAGAAAVLAVARGTDTYKRLFAGIQQGEKAGLFSDEQGYRQYVNQMNDISNRFQGRGVTTQETLDWINGGRTANQFEQHLGGQAYIAANRNDIQYALGNFGNQGEGQATDQQLSQLGDNTLGLNNITGTMLQKKLDVARSRLNDIFQGTLASPSLSVLNSGNVAQTGAAGRPQDIQT